MDIPTSKVELSGITQIFQAHGHGSVTAVDNINLQIPAGRFVSLIGTSGCGKSTLFNIIAGLLTPSDGKVLIDGEDMTGRIGLVGYMLQKDLLFPWRNVIDNIILGLELQGVKLSEARQRALPYIYRYGLGGFEHHYPESLSGGMKQRAALLRTLLYDTDVVLLDEPFGALDAQTRADMQEWLLQIWSEMKKTVLFVTHDVDEAVYLSDEIYVLSARPGRIKARIDVNLARPRPRSIVTNSAFVRLKEECLGLLTHNTPTDVDAASVKSFAPVAVGGTT